MLVRPVFGHGYGNNLVAGALLANRQRVHDAFETSRIRWRQQVHDLHANAPTDELPDAAA